MKLSDKQEGMPTTPGAYESRAFFAALLAASREDDELAGNILRSIADSMAGEFAPKKKGKKKGD